MFNRKQVIILQLAAVVAIVFLLGLIGAASPLAAFIWALLVAFVVLLVMRQNIFVAEGTDLWCDVFGDHLEPASEFVAETLGLKRMDATRDPESARAPESSDADAIAEPAAIDHVEAIQEDAGVKPEALDGPRNGQPDDLKRISGVGPKLEALLNGLGFYHFDQIASWTEAEITWVDAHLEGFRGRVRRDGWVAQAQQLRG